jgi:hypothetical protein
MEKIASTTWDAQNQLLVTTLSGRVYPSSCISSVHQMSDYEAVRIKDSGPNG